MQFSHHCNSLFSSLSYSSKGILIDVGDMWNGFSEVSSVLLTHAHFDHIYGLNELCERNLNAKVYTNDYGRMMLLDAKKNMSYYHEAPFVFRYPERVAIVNDGDEIKVGNDITAKAVFTPGHNPSCITWIIDDSIFTGDSYIPGIKIVTNLPGGNKQLAHNSERLILELSLNRNVFPGHKLH